MEYYLVHKKYLAYSLSFLGFKYYKFNSINGDVVYSFEDTERFRFALIELTNLKNNLYNN